MHTLPFLYTRSTLQKYLQAHFGIYPQLFDYHLQHKFISRPTTRLAPDIDGVFYSEAEANAIVEYFANREKWERRK